MPYPEDRFARAPIFDAPPPAIPRDYGPRPGAVRHGRPAPRFGEWLACLRASHPQPHLTLCSDPYSMDARRRDVDMDRGRFRPREGMPRYDDGPGYG